MHEELMGVGPAAPARVASSQVNSYVGDDLGRYRNGFQKCKRMVILECPIVLGTITKSCLNWDWFEENDIQAHTVIVDEASTPPDPAIYALIVMGFHKLALFGDLYQLPATVANLHGEKAAIAQATMERLSVLGVAPMVRLDLNYRIPRILLEIMQFSVYRHQLYPSETLMQKWAEPKPNPFRLEHNALSALGEAFAHGLAVLDLQQTYEELSGAGTSFLNRYDARACSFLVRSALKSGIAPERMLVLSNYRGW